MLACIGSDAEDTGRIDGVKPGVHSWFFGRIQPDRLSLDYTQVQQAWIRIPMALLCFAYLYVHAPFFSVYATAFQATASLYILYNLYIIYSIRRHPASPGRLLVSPVLDVYIISFALVIDGGNVSGLSLLYLAIVLGNAFRFGNMMMLYTQALCLAGLGGAAVASLQQLQTDTLWSLLGFQVGALLLLPAYAMSFGQRRSAGSQAKAEAEPVSFGLLDHGPLPIFTYQLDANDVPRILHANSALQTICQEPLARVIGGQVDALALLEDGHVIVNYCRQALQQQDHASFRFHIRGRNASEQILSLMGEATRIHWQGQWIGLCFLVNLTEHDRQSGLQGNAMVTIAHDFRNLLTSIIGQAEILQMDTGDEALQRGLEPIIEAGERGSEMITQLLNTGRKPAAERPRAPLRDIRDTVENLVGLVRLQLPEKVTLSCDIKPDLPVPALPVSEFEQVMMNLIQNAYQAIPEAGAIEIRVGADSRDDGLPGIVIQVSDTGQGIAGENLDRVFDTFWTTRKKQGGTGLGLAMVKRIIEQHHGRINVQSEPGKGSTFTIRLPAGSSAARAAASDRQPLPKHADPATEAVQTQPWRILLVDDSPVVLNVHQAMLTRMGHRVVAVPDAKSALTHFEQPDADVFDLILTDYNMPGMDGVEMIQELRRRGISLPMMVITAYGEEGRLQLLGQLDAGIIHKPVSYRALSAHIAAIQASQRGHPSQPETDPTSSEAENPS
jgi:signal transduction histidine kinase/CheY-like chemotaxis protein